MGSYYFMLPMHIHIKALTWPLPRVPAQHCRSNSRRAPSLWETSLPSNVVSHWLDASLDSALTLFSVLLSTSWSNACGVAWWRHQMETFSALLTVLPKRLSKQSWGWWFETLSCSLWRQCNGKGPRHCHYSQNERDGVPNHRRHDWLLNRLFRRRSKKTSKVRVIGLCEEKPPVTGGFP